jgi:hypothetical protein
MAPEPPGGPFPQPPGDEAPVALGVQVGQQDGECLADDAAAVDGDAERAEGETGALQFEQLTARQVDGDLLGVALPAAGLALGFERGAPADGTEQLGDAGEAYPPRTGAARSAWCHRSSTSFASSR